MTLQLRDISNNCLLYNLNLDSPFESTRLSLYQIFIDIIIVKYIKKIDINRYVL